MDAKNRARDMRGTGLVPAIIPTISILKNMRSKMLAEAETLSTDALRWIRYDLTPLIERLENQTKERNQCNI